MFSEEVVLFDIILKGFIIGMVVSAPFGPVGILCIQRTLNKGRWYGFITGLGAACSDILYAIFTGYGMSIVFDFISKNINLLQIIGSVMLLGFGYYTFRTDPLKTMRPSSNNKGTYVQNFMTALFVTLSNPLIIFLFIGLFARFNFVLTEVKAYERCVGYAAIALGALTWWFLITFLVSKLRAKFDMQGIVMLNRVIGVIVMVVSAIGLVLSLTGKSIY